MDVRFGLLLCLFLYTGAASLSAQSGAVQDTVNRQLEQAEQLTVSQPERALAAAQKALKLAQKNRLVLSEGKACQRLARIYAERSEYTRALEASKAGIAIFRQLGEHKETCRMYIGMGIINRYLKLYDACIEANLRAEEIAKEHDFQMLLAAIYGNLGNVYFDKATYQQALQYHLKSLRINQTPAMSRVWATRIITSVWFIASENSMIKPLITTTAP
jgi:tetratricopeptide (TPR) repeat protein